MSSTHTRSNTAAPSAPANSKAAKAVKPKPKPKPNGSHAAPNKDSLASGKQKGAKQGRQRRTGERVEKKQTAGTKEEDAGPLVTGAYIRENFTLPVPRDFANAPDEMWQLMEEHDTRAVSLSFLKKVFASKLDFRSSAAMDMARSTHPYRFKISVATYDGQKFVGLGDGTSKSEACRNCGLHTVGQLHAAGIINEFFGNPTIPIVSQEPSGPSPKIAVYEYASRFLLVPRFTTGLITPQLLSQLRVQGTFRPKYACTIELEELDLVATGAGSTYTLAEAAASRRFGQLALEIQHRYSSDDSFVEDFRNCYPLEASTMESFRNFWDHSKGVLTTTSKQTEVQLLNKGTRSENLLYTTQAMHAGIPIGEPVVMRKQASGEDLATLTAAIAFGKSNPALLVDFRAALRAGGGKIMRKLKPSDIQISGKVLHAMGVVVDEQRGAVAPELPTHVNSNPEISTRTRHVRRRTDHVERNSTLGTAFKEYQESATTETMRQNREQLPINQHRAKILDTVSDSPFTVVVGATGSGKTTQVPQMFLEAATEAGAGASCNVICTQPRRIAATSVARRVAEERAEKLTDSVGYIVRHDSAPPKQDGSILFCTTGILLQQLQHQPDLVFDTTSHILLDEVHERDILLDFLLVVLKKALKQRVAMGKPVPKVVLMSATMNTELFSKYFGSENASGQLIPCPSISVPGRLFPVRNRYLHGVLHELESNYSGSDAREVDALLDEKDTVMYMRKELRPVDERSTNQKAEADEQLDQTAFDPDDALAPVGLVTATVAHVAKTTDEGAILVFLPGQNEIIATERLLTHKSIFGIDFKDQSRFKLFVLHSSTPAEDQAAVFKPVPKGCRKIILSTNIAETSVTIPDVQHVIDSGKHRENRYDSINRITALKSAWISQANAKQRAGRAGRVQNGNYYGLYTEERLAKLRITGKAEMLRSDLQEICLDVKAHGFRDSVGDFLSQALEPPSSTSVQSAIKTLRSLEALTSKEELTPLGELLAALPVEPALGKMIVLGIIFRCLDPLIILGALSGSRSLFSKPSGKRSEWEVSHIEWLKGSQSEHIAQVSAFKSIRLHIEERGYNAAYAFANENFISMRAYEQTRRAAQDIEQILVKSQLIPHTLATERYQYGFGSQSLNTNSENVPLLKALALVGFAPNLAINTHGRWFRTRTLDDVLVHPKSTMSGRHDHVNYGGATVTYSTLFNSDMGSLSMRDVTEVSHTTSLLFGGKLKMKASKRSEKRFAHHYLEVDNWLPFRVGKDPDAILVNEFRKTLDTFLTTAFRELTSHRVKNASSIDGEKTYFSDDIKRNQIAASFVKVINKMEHGSLISVTPPPSKLDPADPRSRGHRIVNLDSRNRRSGGGITDVGSTTADTGPAFGLKNSANHKLTLTDALGKGVRAEGRDDAVAAARISRRKTPYFNY